MCTLSVGAILVDKKANLHDTYYQEYTYYQESEIWLWYC
jgi:hypothetical protein